MDDLAALYGARLREARRARGWSLAQLATAAGIGKGTLSEIENGHRNPTLSTLYALANALRVPLSTLLAEQAGAHLESPGIVAELLDVRHHAHGTAEVYRIVLAPGEQHRSAAHGPGVVEHLIVTAGRVRVGRAGEEVELSVGESTQWLSDTEHSYAALGDEPAEAVQVIRVPAGSHG